MSSRWQRCTQKTMVVQGLGAQTPVVELPNSTGIRARLCGTATRARGRRGPRHRPAENLDGKSTYVASSPAAGTLEIHAPDRARLLGRRGHIESRVPRVDYVGKRPPCRPVRGAQPAHAEGPILSRRSIRTIRPALERVRDGPAAPDRGRRPRLGSRNPGRARNRLQRARRTEEGSNERLLNDRNL